MPIDIVLSHVHHNSVHLISRSSACSDNHRGRGKVLEGHKAAGTPAQTRMKNKKASRVSNAELKIMTDLNFIN